MFYNLIGNWGDISLTNTRFIKKVDDKKEKKSLLVSLPLHFAKQDKLTQQEPQNWIQGMNVSFCSFLSCSRTSQMSLLPFWHIMLKYSFEVWVIRQRNADINMVSRKKNSVAPLYSLNGRVCLPSLFFKKKSSWIQSPHSTFVAAVVLNYVISGNWSSPERSKPLSFQFRYTQNMRHSSSVRVGPEAA